METLFIIVALVVMWILYCMDSKNRENELEISELKQRKKYLESRESSLEESKDHYMEKAEKFENAYYELLGRVEELESKLESAEYDASFYKTEFEDLQKKVMATDIWLNDEFWGITEQKEE